MKSKTAKSRPSAGAPAKTRKVRPAPSVEIDFPQEREMIAPGEYSVRISAPPDAEVELAIDGEGWAGCRQSAGFYWFDWKPSETGTHTLAARVRAGGRAWARSSERACIVVEAR